MNDSKVKAESAAVPSRERLDRPIDISAPEGLFAERFSLGKLPRLMKCFGPAAVAASVAIGAGETLVVVITGAWAQYQLLWLVLLSCLAKGLVTTYLLGRYTAMTGEFVGHRLARLPGPRGWLLLALIVIELGVAGFVCVVISRPCGNLLAFLAADFLPGPRTATGVLTADWFHLWEKVLAITFLVLASCASLKISYDRLEKQNLVICGILVGGTLLASLMVRPDLVQALEGAITPRFPTTPWETLDPNTGAMVPSPAGAGEHDLSYVLLMVTIFGYVGGTVFTYVAYSSWVGLHGWGITSHAKIDQIRQHLASGGGYSYLPNDAEQVRNAQRRLTPLRWDVGLGTVVLFVVTASFMMAGAQILYPLAATEGIPRWQDLLTEQRHVWQEIHAALVPVYYVCILAALWGTVNALPEIWARVTHEFLSAIWPSFERFPYRQLQAIVVAFVLIPGVCFLAMEVELQIMAAIVAVFTTNLAVAVVCMAGLYINWTLPRAYRPRKITIIAGTIATAILAISTAAGLIGLAQRFNLI